MNPIILQKQLKENAVDFEEFYKDLKKWGEDMKKKEEHHRKSRKVNSNGNKPQSTNFNINEQKNYTKIGYTDYSVWDKFDADAECEKIDYNENDESELTDEYDEALRDQAYVEKEKGNKYVKNQKWDEAIKCYTKAIECYSYDPVFYANRALCFLKKENMVKAETDCTTSLKLDNTYVKAYQRRALAREVLNKPEEAELDLLKVLELEPKNKEAKKNLDNLRNQLNKTQKVVEVVPRPVSKFTDSRQQKSMFQQTSTYIRNKEDISQQPKEMDSQNIEYWPSGDNVILVKTVIKPAHLQSKKPLKRIVILETFGFNENKDFKADTVRRIIRTDDLKIVERTFHQNPDSQEMLKETKNQTNTNKMKEEIKFCVPKNSVQFYTQWKYLKILDEKYAYMKSIEPEELPHIFKESLDSNIFSEILEVLAKCFVKNNDKIFDFLFFFSKMKRFSTFTMFLTDSDKN
ncbi:RNA polymerase II-associated protein 3, partial [Asbolus verrucosus]